MAKKKPTLQELVREFEGKKARYNEAARLMKYVPWDYESLYTEEWFEKSRLELDCLKRTIFFKKLFQKASRPVLYGLAVIGLVAAVWYFA